VAGIGNFSRCERFHGHEDNMNAKMQSIGEARFPGSSRLFCARKSVAVSLLIGFGEAFRIVFFCWLFSQTRKKLQGFFDAG
jgi:hypothetical protein